MSRSTSITVIIILVIFAFCAWAILPLQSDRFGRQGLHLGLDLVGGVDLVYQAEFSDNATSAQKKADMERAVLTIEKRINKYGVAEPIIQQVGADRIMVQLPGFTDIDAAKNLVEQTGFLEFREAELNDQGQPVYLKDYLDQTQLHFIDTKDTGNRIFVATSSSQSETVYTTVAFLSQSDNTVQLTNGEGIPVDNTTALQQYGDALSWIPARGDNGQQLSGDYLSDAAPVMSQDITPKPEVSIKWNAEGSIIFDQIAKRLYNPNGTYAPQYLLGIFLDNNLLSAPRVNAAQFNGSAVITGSFTVQQADDLATLLKSGSLPMPLQKPPLYQEKVSATLGANFIHLSWLAGLIGIILVMLFMIAYYRVPGFLASLALVFYGVVILAIFKLWPVTLSLAGIGGFVVSIGMAVDANVLIFERLKEELRAGRTLGAAIEAGFKRAWTAILDSNVTTIIACVILIWLASSVIASAQVMGFAITLLIGVIVSMFTAIIVTRTLLRLFIRGDVAKRLELFSTDRPASQGSGGAADRGNK
jgi:preprotein translocase subunit SecD